MTQKSRTLIKSDFETKWYKKWARLLKQDANHLEGHDIKANKFWQNAVMAETLSERGYLKPGRRGIGFGVGRERLPALFARHKVHVTATDQDFRKSAAKYWSKHELAMGSGSLNGLGICDDKTFTDMIDYEPVDMRNIPDELRRGEYDFLWSNCALGHLGSIPEALTFINSSLECLKPGGMAVHTTELNVLSDDETVTSGSTVVLRLRDIYKLQKELLGKGYIAGVFHFDAGSRGNDWQVSMNPQFGNGYSKIQIMGHLATQILLIIEVPKKRLSAHQKLLLAARYRQSYKANMRALRKYRAQSTVKEILDSQNITEPSDAIVLTPIDKKRKFTVKAGQTKEVYVGFNNESEIPLFSLYNRLADSNPIVLATSNPRDRASAFYDQDTWVGELKNRAACELYLKDKKGVYHEANYIEPSDKMFWFKLTLKAPKKKGSYSEAFEIVLENRAWIEDTQFTANITVS